MNDANSAGAIGAAILIGGGSTRMRQAKHLLSLGGESLIARAFDLAGTVAEIVTVVGGVDEESALTGLSPGQRHAATAREKFG